MSSVEKLLQEKNIYFLEKGKDILIKCLNPEHEDAHPSMRIDRETGKFHCFSCSHKGNIFSYFNRYQSKVPTIITGLQDTVRNIRNQASGEAIPPGAYPFHSKSWRGLSSRTLERFHAFKDDKEFEDRIAFPIIDSLGIIRYFVARYEHSDAKPKYMLKPSGSNMILFPAPKHLDLSEGKLVIVEGILDALNLYDKGMDFAVASFGTSQINKENVETLLLPYLIAGVQEIFILYDADAAGSRGALKLQELLKHKLDLIQVEIVELSEGTDPGDLDHQNVKIIKNHLLKL